MWAFLVDVLDFVIVLFQNGVLKYILFVSAWMLLHVYVLVDVLGFVIVLFQSGVFEHVLCSRGCCYTCMFWLMF